MSILCEYVVVANVLEGDAPMGEVNEALAAADIERRQQFRKLDMDQAGGSKVFTDGVWAACFNHVLPEAVRSALAGADWKYPDAVMVVEDTEYDDLSPQSVSIVALRTPPPETSADLAPVSALVAAALKLADTHDDTVDSEWGGGQGETRTAEAEAVRAAVAALQKS